MGFSRQEYWSGLPSPPPGDLPNPGPESCLLHWQVGSLPLVPPAKPVSMYLSQWNADIEHNDVSLTYDALLYKKLYIVSLPELTN